MVNCRQRVPGRTGVIDRAGGNLPDQHETSSIIINDLLKLNSVVLIDTFDGRYSNLKREAFRVIFIWVRVVILFVFLLFCNVCCYVFVGVRCVGWCLVFSWFSNLRLAVNFYSCSCILDFVGLSGSCSHCPQSQQPWSRSQPCLL